MKLPDVLSSFLKKKEGGKEYYFSLFVDVDAAAVAVWYVDGGHEPKIVSFAHGLVATDSWDSRITVIDKLLSAAEDKVGVEKPVEKTVFGLAPAYLTPEGNIADSVRPHLRKLTKLLDLTAVGFVPVEQALAFLLKQREGVPPSVIFVGVNRARAHVTIFRVGKGVTDDTVELGDDPSVVIEQVFKANQDGEVLPSRILLYGGNTAALEIIRTKLLKHPWPSRANFMHFPKIELIGLEDMLTAVSQAGASELTADIGEDETAESSVSSTVVAQPRPSAAVPAVAEAGEEEKAEEEDELGMDEHGEDDAGDETEEEEDASGGPEDDEEEEPSEIVSEADPGEAAISGEDEETNVRMVTPESLGFRTEDILEKPSKPEIPHMPGGHAPAMQRSVHPVARRDLEAVMEEGDDEDFRPPTKRKLPIRLPAVSGDMFAPVVGFFTRIPLPRRGAGLIGIGAVVLIALIGLLVYLVPQATVTVLVLPKTLEQSATLSVDSTATVVDPGRNIIPGYTLSQSVSGEKTVPATGKKSVGDPAKGTVTIYNKVTSPKTFAKGTVVQANGLSFTLDSDVSVASASESIGSITFGKADADVTAKDIGPNGNLPAGAEFSFANTSDSQASARNASAFTGGTSKQVTVVSRTDQDNLVKALTDDLVSQAKSQLGASSAGSSGQRLIDETVKTAVSDKSFDQEVNQEAKDLHGKITVTVSGIRISDDDIKGLLTSQVSGKTPAGYTVDAGQTTVSIAKATVKKDGSITITAQLSAVALPTIDTAGISAKLAGQDVDKAKAILKETNGVAGAEFLFRWSPTSSRLPFKAANISVTTTVSR